MTPPTPTEVEELARELRLQAWYSDPHQFARWILTRFVRREERQHHFDLLLEDNARLRAELKGQRCVNGLIEVCEVVHGEHVWRRCVGCPACKPTDDESPPTPKGDECPHEAWETARGGFGRKCADCGQWLSDDGGRTRESVSEAVESTRDRAPSKVPDVPAAPVVHVVKLHEDTVRALVAATLLCRDWESYTEAADGATTLLAKLKETKGCL